MTDKLRLSVVGCGDIAGYTARFSRLVRQVKLVACADIDNVLVVEMSAGQMLEDVKLAIAGQADIAFHGRPGGIIPTPAEFARFVLSEYQKQKELKWNLRTNGLNIIRKT